MSASLASLTERNTTPKPKSGKDLNARKIIKAAVAGLSGSGKTAQIAGLLNAGYTCIVFDYDDGLEIIRSYANAQAIEDRLHFVTLTDALTHREMSTTTGGKIIVVTPESSTAYSNTVQLIEDKWPCGFLSKLDHRHVVFFESGSRLFENMMNHAQSANPNSTRWDASGAATGLMLAFLSTYLGSLKKISCHTVFNFHLKWANDPASGQTIYQPAFPGTIIPANFSSYFNHVLAMVREHDGHYLVTQPAFIIPWLKNPYPGKVPERIKSVVNKSMLQKEMQLTGGLAEYFNLVNGPLENTTNANS